MIPWYRSPLYLILATVVCAGAASSCQLLVGIGDHHARSDCEVDGEACEAGRAPGGDGAAAGGAADVDTGEALGSADTSVDAADTDRSVDRGDEVAPADGADTDASADTADLGKADASVDTGDVAANTDGGHETAPADGNADVGPDLGDPPDGSEGGCALPSDLTYYVDPAAPDGGTGSLACKFRTLTQAFNAITSSGANQAADVVVQVARSISPSTEGAGAFPLSVPARLTIRGMDEVNWPTVTTPLNTTAFRFMSAAGGGLEFLRIQQEASGSAGAAVEVSGTRASGNLIPIQLRSIGLSYFGYGIDVQKDGYVTVLAGVTASSNSYGLHVLDGFVRISVANGESAAFDKNLKGGIHVEGDSAILDMHGANGATYSDRSISVSYNFGDGIRMHAPAGQEGKLGLTSQIAGVKLQNNTADGLHLFGGTAVRVRDLYLYRNPVGIRVTDTGAVGATNDFGGIDLGHVDEADPGGNRFNGNNTGICFDLQNTSDAGLLRAEGNIFGSPEPGSRECYDPITGPSQTVTTYNGCGSSLHVTNLGSTTPLAFSAFVSVEYCKLP